MPEAFEAYLVDVLGERHEALVAGDVGRRQPGDLRAHGLRIARAVYRFAIVEADPVERIEPAQIDIVGKPAPAKLPELFEQEGRGYDRWSGVERVAVLAEHPRAATGRIECLQNRDLIPAGAQPHGRRQSPETASDHDRMRSPRARLAHSLVGIECQHNLTLNSVSSPLASVIARLSPGKRGCDARLAAQYPPRLRDLPHAPNARRLASALFGRAR